MRLAGEERLIGKVPSDDEQMEAWVRDAEIEQSPGGRWLVSNEKLPGLRVEGNSRSEAVRQFRPALRRYVQECRLAGWDRPLGPRR